MVFYPTHKICFIKTCSLNQHEVWGRGCYITLFSPNDVTAFHRIRVHAEGRQTSGLYPSHKSETCGSWFSICCLCYFNILHNVSNLQSFSHWSDVCIIMTIQSFSKNINGGPIRIPIKFRLYTGGFIFKISLRHLLLFLDLYLLFG